MQNHDEMLGLRWVGIWFNRFNRDNIGITMV